MNRFHDHLVRSGITKFHRLPDNDISLVAGYVRRSRALALTLSPATGGPARIFDDPAFALVPLRDDDLDFTVGVTWRRDRAGAGDVAALSQAALRAWRDGPAVI
jgi:hypothetical protein